MRTPAPRCGWLATALALAALAGGPWGCKVPLTDLEASFTLADVSWFAEEQTLFVFYEVAAQQGLGEESLLEIRYATDEGVVDWTELRQLTMVHTHLPVDCGTNARCGSASLHVPREPREVALRLRFHRDGELSLDAPTVFNVVGPGPSYSQRSALIYGVFDAHDRGIQWRARHRFPTIRNEQAQRLGLRRRFVIEDQRHGEAALGDAANPYAYAVPCPASFAPLDLPRLETEERAVFNPTDLPAAAAASSVVWARATVFTPLGPFGAGAVARKNPEVRPAFPVLRSPVEDATPLPYLLAACAREISSDHRAMQRQRLLLGDIPPLCIDGWSGDRLTRELASRWRADIERGRAGGRDMVLAVALHHDQPGTIGPAVEAALAGILVNERERATPRVAGAFLLDSYAYTIADPEVGRSVLWCPARPPVEEQGGEAGEDGGTPADAGPWRPRAWDVDLGAWRPGDGGADEPRDAGLDTEGDAQGGAGGGTGSLASLACALIPDNLQLTLGPFSVGTLPILPSRAMYLDFIADYSAAQAGEVTALAYRVPELPPSATHLPVPPYGTATFFNDEAITADPDDAFSFCVTDEYAGFVFRSTRTGELLPLSLLPDWHEQARESSYPLGIVWDFPFLLRMEYQTVLAGSVSAFSLSVPFGYSLDGESDFGSALWTAEEFPLARSLTQCTRYCDHPTFDAGGVYQVEDRFREAYRAACYQPRFPTRGDPGFPHDP